MELQDVVDDLAAALGRPVSLDDQRWRLLAYSAQTDRADAVRRTSILARTVPPEVQAWLDGLALGRAGDVADVPANPALGMAARACAPVRHGGTVFGFLWVIPGDAPLTPDERAALAAAASAAGLVLRRRRAQERQERRHETERLHALLGAAAGPARRAAAEALRADLDWPPGAPYVVLAAAGAEGGDPLETVAERARRAWDAGRLLWVRDGGRLAVLARLGPGLRASPDAALRAVAAAGATRAGAAAVRADLADAPDALTEAGRALRLAAAVPALGPLARWDALGSWGLVAALLGDAAPAPPEPLLRVLAHPGGAELLEALEAVLDHAGDVAAAATALSMHRATLYRRLHRVEALTGLSLADGDARLVLHLGLRLWRLGGAGATAVAPAAPN
jgi:hypothetical protein